MVFFWGERERRLKKKNIYIFFFSGGVVFLVFSTTKETKKNETGKKEGSDRIVLPNYLEGANEKNIYLKKINIFKLCSPPLPQLFIYIKT